MHAIQDNYITQNRIFSNTGKIGGVHQPDYNDVHVYSKSSPTMSDSQYNDAIVEQAIKDQAAGKFQTESQGFNKLAKSYVSVVSPDRKKIITEGLQQIAKKNVATTKELDVIALLFGEVKFRKVDNSVTYAEFKDSNGEMVAKFSNGGWTMLNTKAETACQIDMCTTYNKAWNEAAKASKGGCNTTNRNGFTASVGCAENTIDMSA